MGPNLIVYTGAAEYGQPSVESVITIEAGKLSVDAIE